MAKNKDEPKEFTAGPPPKPVPKRPIEPGEESTVLAISKSTLLPIGFVITILVAAVIGVWEYQTLVHRVEDLKEEVAHLKGHLEERTQSRFTRDDFRTAFTNWIRVFQASNSGSGIIIPSVD